ncbi:MAG: hypothetical protein EBR02_01460 [Alphaproteobacteria bacterium]|nr:hypothetical protein [Alphaproteobacteria bacterium]
MRLHHNYHKCYTLFLRVTAITLVVITGAHAQIQDVEAPKMNPPADVTPVVPTVTQEVAAAASSAKSILVSGEQIAAIRAALAAYKNQDTDKGAGDYLSQITDGAKNIIPNKKAPPFVYPQFYLESLIFNSTKSWTVSVNGRKLAAEDKIDDASDLRVVSIDNEKVTLVWKPVNIERVKSSWAAVEKHSNVYVDIEGKTVTFSLRRNQTFSSYLMEVMEGKVMPVQATDDGKMKVEDVVESTEDSFMPVSADNKAEISNTKSKKGLGGLINSYKKLEEPKP